MYTEYYFDDIADEDCITEEELQQKQQKAYEERYNAPLSMENLGLSWSDFI